MKRPSSSAARAYPSKEDGFTLLEVLVSIVILSIGLLGSAGMLIQAMQSNKVAREQATGARLGRELGELMRANKSVAITTSTATNPYLVDFSGTLPTTTVECYTTRCLTTLEVAQWNIREWLARVSAELPGARAVVCFDATPYVVAAGPTQGIPQWPCSDSGGTAVVKLGWTTLSSDNGTGTTGGLDRATRPMIVYPVIAGSVE